MVDGAQSLGSTYNGKPCFSYGVASTTSFHAAKILSTIEGGMVFTDNKELFEKMKKIRNQGEGDEKYIHEILGGNYRMTDVSAAFGIKQLKRIASTLAERRKKYEHYKKNLKKKLYFPKARKSGDSCNFLCLALSEKRDELFDFLGKNGIETRKIYPKLIPEQPVFNETADYPTAKWFCSRGIALPLHNSLTNSEINFVCEKVEEFFAHE